jgi:hypothetical protein
MNRFVGAWRLVSFEETMPNGEVTHPYGRDALGLLIYDSSGWMSVQIMRRDRDSLSSSEVERCSGDEIKKAVAGFTAFFGAYEIDEVNRVVTHHVEGHVLPDSVGKSLRREYSFDGNRLILRPSLERTVTWERIIADQTVGVLPSPPSR